ncbi:hypothetical protein BIFGAL_02523 [Bifidobacterium gallicum DSM 20093 = LMG 11596]|uniref:Uncharacterized protein n=1 Tax=Bifidobacterium gallicum DSM 20093 = LMG 11596 TaxID=561180 RepID=D1NRX2_9BIFI|nr:hypothetical protein BIFGAL_02523 [Bifidobacterium gallicum DSM 20093 = LMG 11596]
MLYHWHETLSTLTADRSVEMSDKQHDVIAVVQLCASCSMCSAR